MLYAGSQAGFLVWIVRYMTLQYHAESLGAISLSLYWVFCYDQPLFCAAAKDPPARAVPVRRAVDFCVPNHRCAFGQRPSLCARWAGVVGFVSGHCVPMILSEGSCDNPGNSSLVVSSLLVSIFVSNIISPLFMGALASTFSLSTS